MARQKRASEAPLEVALRRLAFRAAGALAPERAGMLATDLFLRSRDGEAGIADVTPLAARRLPLRGTVKHAYAWGSAHSPTVLLVHGWGADSSSLYSLARPLRAAGFRVVTYDAPAHGTSPGRSTTMTEFVAALRGVLDGLGDVVAILGHSLGAVATIAALDGHVAPALARVVLISAPASLDDALRAFADFWRLSPRVVEHVRDQLSLRNGVPIEHWDIRARGAQCTLPVLALHDDDDVFVPVAELVKVVDALPHAEGHVTRGLGHARILADQDVAHRVASFLSPLVARAPGDEALDMRPTRIAAGAR